MEHLDYTDTQERRKPVESEGRDWSHQEQRQGRKSIKKSSTCGKVPLVSEYTIKNVSNSSQKRPITVDKCGDSQEQEKHTAVPSCKKQKVMNVLKWVL